MSVEAFCHVCRKSLPEGAAICTECESWQLVHRYVTLLAKLVLVTLAPLAAWFIAEHYQKHEAVRSATEAHVTRVTEQIGGLIDMAKEFQLASDSFAANCSAEAQGAVNLFLSEYMARIVHINELVAQLSWRSGVLPMSEQIDAEQKRWQEVWWKGVSGRMKIALGRMAMRNEKNEVVASDAPMKTRRLLACQAFDFSSSSCGGEVNEILADFRQETTTLMCVFSQALRTHLRELYLMLPKSDEKTALVRSVDWQLEQSFCARLVKQPPTPR
jgi:hypothetical protein